MYLFGEGGVTVDETRARGYIEEAAKRGHLFARRDVARRMMSGAVGAHRIPLGVLSLLGAYLTVVGVGWNDPHSDRLLRL